MAAHMISKGVRYVEVSKCKGNAQKQMLRMAKEPMPKRNPNHK